MLLNEKVAIVTGGGRGIGRAIVRRFAQEGASVVIADVDEETGRAVQEEVTASGGIALFSRCDVADRDQVEATVAGAVEQFGQLDILVNNAGITGENGPFLEVSQETWDRILRVNQTALFICGQVAGRVMADARQGCIINISSVNGLVPQPRVIAYAAAKAAVESMTRSMAIDLAPYNIRVNAIAPGPIQVNLPDDAPTRPIDTVLLGRTGLPAEVAAAAAFLASDQASYITGERIAVDGGKLVNGYTIYGEKLPRL